MPVCGLQSGMYRLQSVGSSLPCIGLQSDGSESVSSLPCIGCSLWFQSGLYRLQSVCISSSLFLTRVPVCVSVPVSFYSSSLLYQISSLFLHVPVCVSAFQSVSFYSSSLCIGSRSVFTVCMISCQSAFMIQSVFQVPVCMYRFTVLIVYNNAQSNSCPTCISLYHSSLLF